MKIILVDAVNTLVIKDQGIFQEMYNLLEQYLNKKIVVTNANDEQIIIFGLDKMPYEVFTLKHDPKKIDPNYFRILIQKYGFKIEDIVYFEHNIDAVKSAQSLGINTYHYNPVKKDLVSLKIFLDYSLKN
jgi:HAD superfamily hydrolase (TIGR01509 family)